MHMIRFAAITVSLAAAVPAFATLPAPITGYRLGVGDFPGINTNGNVIGSYSATSGNGTASLVTALLPTPSVSAHVSNGNFSSVAEASGYVDYDFTASFTASTGFGGAGGAPVRVAGYADLTSTPNAQAVASFAGNFLACYNGDTTLSNGCGTTHFSVLTTANFVSAVDRGGGLSRYTFGGEIDLGVDAAAFENYTRAPRLRYTASAYLDPVIDFDPLYLASIGAIDPDIQLSPGVGNDSAPPPAVGAVPEPADWMMLFAGLGFTGLFARRGRMVRVAA